MTKHLSILAFLICFTLPAGAQSEKQSREPYPEPKGFVNDFEDILTKEEEKNLEDLLSGFEKETQNEMAVVTLNGLVTSSEEFESYTLRLANYWGVGKKELDNGILIAVSADLRVIRIHNGYGIEKIITDEETKQIIDTNCIPHFRNGEYYEGIESGAKELMKLLITKE